MGRRRSRGFVAAWWLTASVPVKITAVGLAIVLLTGVATTGLIGPFSGGDWFGGSSYAHGPEQRWGSATASDRPSGQPGNRTLPNSLRARYPSLTWNPSQNAASVETPPATEATGFDPKTSKEIPAARGAYDTTYANPDGTETTEFSTAPVNYRTPDGWQPIDTRLTSDGKSGWRNTADAVGLHFAPTAAAPDLATVTTGPGQQVSFGLDGAAAVTGTVGDSAITYPAVRPHVDLKLESVSGGVKETLVLDSPDAPTSYTFPLRLNGLTPRLANGQITLADSAGTTKAVVPAGDMIDAGAARSAGVTYRLAGDKLEVSLDAAWLRDPDRQFPVQVDPTVKMPVDGGSGTDAMYVQEGVGSAKGDQDLLVGTVDGHQSASYVKFSDLVGKLQYHTIFGAQLWMVEYNSDSCKPREITVNPVTGSWTGGSGYNWPGPAVGGSLASKSFAHGYIAFGHSSSDCPTAGETINLGAAGRDLVQRWVNGDQANNGLSIRGSSDALSGKWFTGTGTANPPRLYVTHSPYNASYSIPNPVPNPAVLQNQDGKIKVAVTNKSAEAWAPGSYYLAYRAYNTATGASVVQQRSANLTSTVARGGRVTLDATIKALPPGKYFLDFTMVHTGGQVFTDYQVPPARLVLQVFDIPPVVQELYPPNGFQAPTLTPQLWARALDIDAPPSSSLQFKFEVCLRDDAGKPTNCTQSAYSTKQAYTVPTATLSWTKAYLWRAYVKDASNEVISPYATILTSVPQPDITSRLAGAPYGEQRQDFDPNVGNYSTAAVDASVATVGPQLTLTRTYNSLDPRKDGLFGAGWSSTYDMKLAPDNDGSGNVVVTYPDGQQVRFGKNADGSYSAPAGRTAQLTLDSTSWKLLDKSGTTYQFSTAGRITRLTDNAGHAIVITYDTTTGKLSKAQVSNSQTNTAGRSLTFVWTGNHVTSVTTDPVNGAALGWAYSYTGDTLTKVCGPGSACTNYGYAAGSHYRSTVLDSHPESYWRLGEPDGAAAGSEVTVNVGKDAATYSNVTLGTAGALAGTSDTAVSFNGATSAVTLPKGTVKKSRDAAVELWFKNSLTGSGGPLLGYQDKALGTASTTGVPVLYVGTDGKLRGQFATGAINPITSATAVNDGKWHQVVLSSMGSTQTLYLDGAKVADLTGQQIDASLLTFNQLGAAYASTPASWPAWGATAQRSYTGAIDDVSVYSGPLGAAAVAAHYKAGTGAADQLSSITLPSGKTAAAITYDVAQDRVKEYTDGNGGTWKVGTPTVYGDDTDLRRSVEVLDPSNRPSLYEYDAIGGWLLRFGLPLGIEARDDDNPGEPTATPPPPVQSCTAPDPNDPAFCTTIPGDSGGPVFVRYDADGVSIRSYTYDDSGMLTKVTDENGDATSMTYDSRGDVISSTTCRAVNDCQTTRTSYPATITNPYDPRSYLATDTRDGRSASATDTTYRTSYTYHSTGQVATRTGPDGSLIQNSYTAGSEAGFSGGIVPAGLLASTMDGRGKYTRYAYYSNGDLAQVTAPSGLITQYTYDAIGRKVTEKEISDSYPSGLVTTFGYDGWSRLATVTEPQTTDAVTNVKHQRKTATTYDVDGDPTRVDYSDVLGGDPTRTTTTDYDDHDRPVRTTDGVGNETGYGYDQFGNLTSQTDPNGNRYDFAYTARNSLAEVRLRDWHSDPPGAPATGTGDYLLLHAYSYDFAGRLASDTDAMGRRTEYTYYGDGKTHLVVLKGFHNPDGSTKDYVLEDDSYDAAGNLTKQVTDNGATTTQHTPDLNGRPVSTVVDPNGLSRTTTYKYDANGNVTHTEVSGKASNVPWIMSTTPAATDYTYDDAGNPLTTTVTDGTTPRTTSYTYDQRGLQTSVTDPRGNVAGANKAAYTTTLSYDELGRQTGSSGPALSVESNGNPATTQAPTRKTGYDTFDDQVELTDERTYTSHATYDAAGRMLTQSNPSYLAPGASQAITPTTKYEYDGNNNITTVTDPRGNVTRTTFDQLDRTSTVDAPSATNDDRSITAYTYSRTGKVLSTVDPNGARTEATYDDLDRQVSGTAVERRPSSAAYTTVMKYDDQGNMLRLTSPTGAGTVNTYDTVGELTSTTDPSGVPTQYGYDFAGRQVRATDGLGRTSQTSYDLLGQVVASADLKSDGSTLRTTRYAYDLVGNRTSVTDPLQATTTYAYDAASQLVSQVEPVDAKTSITSSFGYDAAGNVTRFTDGRGNSTITTYNSLGLPESTIEPATAAQPNAADRTWTVGYDANGNAVRQTEPGGVAQQMTFDAANRLTDATGSGAEATTSPRHLGYDQGGRLVTSGSDTYTYNDRGQILSSSGPSGAASFGYDGDGNQTARTDAAGTTGYSYVHARLDSVTDGLTGTKQQLGYDGAGQVKTVGYGAGRTRTYGYDDFGRTSTDVLTNSASQAVASTTYHYDLDDQLSDKTELGVTTSYSYDSSGRLTSDTTNGVKTDYGWDAAGNRTKAGATTATYDERNRLLTQGGDSYTYTARGTLASQTNSGGTAKYTYDGFDRLAAAPGQTYSYDSMDRVSSRNGTAFTYAGQGNDPVSDGSETYARGPGGDLLAVQSGTSKQLTLSDRHDDVVGAFNPADTTLSALSGTTAYSPFGQVTAHTGDTGNVGYQGDWTDPGTGKVDMGARWYDPTSGAFTSRDSMSLGAQPSGNANRYLYANSDPVNATDPTGNFGWGSVWKYAKKAVGRDDLVEIELQMLWNVIKPTPLGDDSCTAIYGMECDAYYHSLYHESAHDLFCDTHSWTSQCGGGGYPYSSGHGAGSRPNPVGGGGGNSPIDWAERAAEAARKAAYERALRITQAARDAAESAAKHTAIAVGSAATTAVLNLPEVVSSAPTAAAAVVDTIENVVADNKVQAQRLWQAAVDATGAVVAVVSAASQVKTKTDSRRDEGCEERLPEPNYKPVDTSNGDRATGVEACLTYSDLGTGSATNSKIRPPGYYWGRRYSKVLGATGKPGKWINNCHLLGKQLGGDGTNLENLATCSRTTNANRIDQNDRDFSPNMLAVENEVTAAVREKQEVDYTVTPLYDGHRTVPYAFQMDAVGVVVPKGVKPINLHETIPNQIWGVNNQRYNDLGRVVYKGQPVPLAGVK
ncbi:RHS repeat-associated core domain-containing protein [Kutzneria sp. NPDC052558]|uniref:RHS repeat-associated core domain-containing protein n=1 Tax=Kutzneria sp. NPDC052558 TaxID=3364121 RepID=UPI0037C67C88